ncbi:OLC1v1007381C1 [Oldenlandia corymbosa var. corymbosa]|uniref:OLC1v1007381C1 n=1 Tax=Oldenlandia corymbosa var. corymbosa TaxID=529605 RepID=A0AAV1DJ72_OLDCO|nr:OLC1v1007381C1 [Oldenlandia corymbosa var. corymbosa]
MTTEGGEENQRCPLCVEEMDWTDQQFKPCKCGYRLCVWCFHRIIDTAEKDDSDGRCPGCRTIYHKDQIISMQVDFDRCSSAAVAAASRHNREIKPQVTSSKGKPNLADVRVIQRNIAYVIGLPFSLSDEEVLQRKEYFGQYGNVSKVSLSRTAGGAVQRFVNGTCSAYVTYSSEDEALRCIKSVHGFVLDGKSLKASFGTAKYCHAWLRNVPCSNPNCLFLHAIGADEDCCFGKDEVAAVDTRNRVKVVTGVSNCMLKRSGKVLPPPVDGLPNDNNNSDSALENLTATSTSNDSVCETTASVDVVGISSPPGSSVPEKDEIRAEDRRISADLMRSSDQSSVVKVPSPDDHLVSRLPSDNGPSHVELFREEAVISQSSYPARISEDSSSFSIVDQRQSSVHSLKDEASVPITTVNSVLNDQGNELKFQPYTKSDGIQPSSNTFSKEEIAEHLRRIYGYEHSTDADEKGALEAVEKTLLSLDLDSVDDDSFTLPRESGFSFPRRNGVAGAANRNNFGQMSNTTTSFKDHYYLSNPQHQAIFRPPPPTSLAPSGFSLPSTEAPPGFSAYDKPGDRWPNSSSGSLVNTCSLPYPSNLNNQMPAIIRNNGSSYDTGFRDPAILSCVEGKPSNGFHIPSMNTTSLASSNQQMGGLDDETRLWLLMRDQATANLASKYSRNFMPQTPFPQAPMAPYPGYDRVSSLSDGYGYQSRPMMDQSQRYGQSSYGNLSQQMIGNGHISNRYPFSFAEVQRKNEAAMAELQRKERLMSNYYPGYGDSKYHQTANSGDLYSRIFGM